MNRTRDRDNWVRNRRRGLTLVELMIGLAILATISAAAGGMLTAVAHGSSDDQEIRSLIARGKTVSLRMNAAVRGSRMVLDAGRDEAGSYAVLWSRDLDGNGEPSRHEIRRLQFDRTRAVLESYAAVDGSADIELSTGADFGSETLAWMGDGSLAAERWASGVSAFDLALEYGNPQLSRTLSYRITLSQNSHDEINVGTVLLRNQP